MLLTRHRTNNGMRWALDGKFLPEGQSLSTLLEMPRGEMFEMLKTPSNTESVSGEEEVPIDPGQEIWAAGVTYLRSRDALARRIHRGRYVRSRLRGRAS